jgi:hypothetical protein
MVMEIKRWSVDLSANDYSPGRERLSQLLRRGARGTISLKSRPRLKGQCERVHSLAALRGTQNPHARLKGAPYG